MMRVLAVVGVLLIAVIGAIAWYASGAGGPRHADATDPDLVALGTGVYAEHCASCHGKNLEGEPNWRQRKADGTLPAPPHDANGHTWHHPDTQLFELTKLGPAAVAGGGYRSAMVGYADVLEDREIWAVLAYIKSRWPADIRDAQAQRDKASRR